MSSSSSSSSSLDSYPYNASSPDPGVLSSNRVGGFGYGVGISVGILFLITTITLMSYFCTRANTSTTTTNTTRTRATGGSIHAAVGEVEEGGGLGLDEAILMSYPKVVYSAASSGVKGPEYLGGCSICLGDYTDADVLRRLPDCGHLFHLKCVDPWLRAHPTCPLCRSSPIPTPLPTPLAEVVPLASYHHRSSN